MSILTKTTLKTLACATKRDAASIPSSLSARLLVGDVRERLRDVEDASVHCAITSPPYWALRDYGFANQIGLERTFEEHVATLVDVFEEVRRILRPDGTLWFNYGDSYCQQTGNGWKGLRAADPACADVDRPSWLKPRDLAGMPWRIAFALQDAGWYLRCDIVWNKPNAMPEPPRSRPARSHEYVFLLARSERYYFDPDAIAEPTVDGQGTRLPRSVWEVQTKGFAGDHFATFPRELPERCLLAGTSDYGVCSRCGAPWTRQTETKDSTRREAPIDPGAAASVRRADLSTYSGRCGESQRITTGWSPACACASGDVVPATVFDPFAGVATTGVAALRNRRNFVGIEGSRDYARKARRRLQAVAPLFVTVKTE